MWPNESQQLMVDCEQGDMLQNRCDSCCVEEAEFGTRFQMQLLRKIRLIVGILMVLLGLAVVLLGVLTATTILSHKGQCEKLHTGTPVEAVREKQYLPPDVSRPIAMLTVPREQNVPNEILEWQDKNIYCQGGFVYSNGTLIVPAKGMYRVYLQVTFMYEREKHHNRFAPNQLGLKISVEKFSKNYPMFVSLLTSEDTMSCEGGWTKSMYTSGTFELEAGSQLRVKSNHPELIHHQDSEVFFGAESV